MSQAKKAAKRRRLRRHRARVDTVSARSDTVMGRNAVSAPSLVLSREERRIAERGRTGMLRRVWSSTRRRRRR